MSCFTALRDVGDAVTFGSLFWFYPPLVVSFKHVLIVHITSDLLTRGFPNTPLLLFKGLF